MEHRKDIFRANYVGPEGKHLSCLTETTRYGDFKPENQRSIHPRVQNGRTRHKKVDTSKGPGGA